MTELERAKQVIKELAIYSECMCEYCKHNIPCLGEDCEYYQSGVGMYDENGKYYDTKWTCMDFDFGTCEKLAHTPCQFCFVMDDDYNFEWNGKMKGE